VVKRGKSSSSGTPTTTYTLDYLHPSSEGYRVWYEELKKQTGIAGILGQPSAGPAEEAQKGHPPTPEGG